MKRIGLVICLLLAGTIANAQLPKMSPNHVKHDGKQNAQRMQQMQSAKIAFFTVELDLTPAEAEVFWPTYNRLWKEKESAHKAAQTALKSISMHFKKDKALTETELKAVMDRYIENYAAVGELDKKYYAEFLAIMPIEKIARLYKAEEDFRMKMIRDLRKPQD